MEFLTVAAAILWFYATMFVLSFIMCICGGWQSWKESAIGAARFSGAITGIVVTIIISIAVANFLFFGY